MTVTPDQLLYFMTTLLRGAVVAIEIALGALAIAIVLGALLAILQTSRVRALRFAVSTYVEIFRGIPPLAQLFIIYFGLTYVGIELDSFSAAILGLALNGSAVLSDVFGSGIRALHHGQREAALAVGMTPMAAMRYVILPQAMRLTLPPLANYAVNLLKETSIVAAIAAPEIMFFARNLTTETFQTATIYLLAAILYFCMCFPLTRITARLERAAKAWR
jgi:polar amino acid transport system permease protein